MVSIRMSISPMSSATPTTPRHRSWCRGQKVSGTIRSFLSGRKGELNLAHHCMNIHARQNGGYENRRFSSLFQKICVWESSELTINPTSCPASFAPFSNSWANTSELLPLLRLVEIINTFFIITLLLNVKWLLIYSIKRLIHFCSNLCVLVLYMTKNFFHKK